jgi:hypothetical protein
MARSSRWTTIYADFATDKTMFHYIRFTPAYVNLEAIGYPHGWPITSQTFPNKDAAIVLADKIDAVLDIMADAIRAEAVGKKKKKKKRGR